MQRTWLSFVWCLIVACFLSVSGVYAEVTEDDFTGDAGRRDLSLFTSPLCVKLKAKPMAARVDEITNPVIKEMVTAMMKGTYKKARLTVALPYYPLDLLSKELKIGGYNQFENPTGIFFKQGEVAVVFVGPTKGEELKFHVHSFESSTVNADKKYPLKEGVNVIPMECEGLAYIDYFTTTPKAPRIPVNVATGAYNGVFYGAKNTNEDWKKLLDGAVSEYMDIRGKYVHLVYQVEGLKKYCPEKGKG